MPSEAAQPKAAASPQGNAVEDDMLNRRRAAASVALLPKRVIGTFRSLITAPFLGLEEGPLPPKYDVSKVEAEVLKVVGEHLPEHLVIGALLTEVIADPSDEREVSVGTKAIHSLIEVGLFTQELDQSVVPTEAGLRAIKLLT